jgi:uncharacterized membrane protein SpoIIM required for sporulation
MDINEAFRSAYATLVSKPSSVLPFYLMSVSVPAVARVAPLLTGVFVYLALLRRGSIDEIRSALDDVPLDEVGNAGGFEGMEETGEELAELFDLILVPEVVAVIVLASVVFVVVVVALNAAVNAGQVGAVYGVLTGVEKPVDRGISSVFEHTSTFVLLFVAEAVAILVATAVLLGVGSVSVSTGGILGAALGLVVGLVWLATVVGIHVFFVFAPQSVVVDGVGLRGALRGNLDFVTQNPAEFIAYLIFAFAALIGFGSVAGFLNVLGAPAAVTVVGFVIFSPFVAVVKTDMYTRHAGEDVEDMDGSVDVHRVTDALREGLDETRAFVTARPLLVVVSGLIFVGSAVGAWEATQAAGVGIETSISNRLEGMSPVGEFFNYTANNWAVGVAQSYAGFVFGVATVVSLVFNGSLIGFLTATEANLVELTAFIVPHGIIEIPALLISGGLGLHLGGVGIGYVRGRVSAEEVADETRRAYRIFVGLLVLFGVAGFVEGFISPYYYGPLLGI